MVNKKLFLRINEMAVKGNVLGIRWISLVNYGTLFIYGNEII